MKPERGRRRGPKKVIVKETNNKILRRREVLLSLNREKGINLRRIRKKLRIPDRKMVLRWRGMRERKM